MGVLIILTLILLICGGTGTGIDRIAPSGQQKANEDPIII